MLVEVMLELVDDDLKWLELVVVVVWERRSIVATSCTQSGAGSRPGRTIAHRTERALTQRWRAADTRTVKRAGRGNREGGEGLCL